ncbi:hypothetical protein PDIG_31230 [Penicillium digitatum PHI26]|uniref:Uncharacterized protein n=2 Tax=Penicillium digitatum TaxID=36651 RepID=K9FY56_PEND2|nr:hypothetical protein PDIP_50810 [Penicillium digitatum Pd1]EKV12896.1 hypothetical protein PDIP_50810 [Penicillium digitatum Pd1]EKV14670.1 hypothetical protein PDIG_31230 [Penicillium digitatum PHI26]
MHAPSHAIPSPLCGLIYFALELDLQLYQYQ